jgi:hypothetical protein
MQIEGSAIWTGIKGEDSGFGLVRHGSDRDGALQIDQCT